MTHTSFVCCAWNARDTGALARSAEIGFAALGFGDSFGASFGQSLGGTTTAPADVSDANPFGDLSSLTIAAAPAAAKDESAPQGGGGEWVSFGS